MAYPVRLVGIFTSMLIPETARKTLEELTGKFPCYFIEAHATGEEDDNVPLISPGFKEESPGPILKPSPADEEGDDSSVSISPGFKEPNGSSIE